MAKRPVPTEFIVERDDNKCIRCQVCCRMCSNDAHTYDSELDKIESDSTKCVGCHFCETLCPTNAIIIRRNPSEFKENSNWKTQVISDITKQAETGGVLLTGMGCDRDYPIYWDHILLNASQVTNPSIDPLREPMELRTYIGRKPDKVEFKTTKSLRGTKCRGNLIKRETQLPPQLKLEMPVLFSAMSYGSISFNACKSLAMAAEEMGTFLQHR